MNLDRATRSLRISLRVFRSEFCKFRRSRGFDQLPEPVQTSRAETVECLPALYELKQIERVRSCGFKSTIDEEVKKLNASSFVEGPKTKYILEDAVIAGGRIYLPEGCHLLRDLSAIKNVGLNLKCYSEATLLNSQQGLKYFGHWLRDDCAVYEDIRHTTHLFSMKRPDWPDRKVYEDAFNQTWEEIGFAHVGQLTLYREMGFNRDKARRIQILRQKLRAMHHVRNEGRVAYIRRGKSGVDRNISNQDQVEAAFAAAGIHIVEPDIDGQALVQELLDASMIITVEGSQATHGVYNLADKGSLLILQPPERFYNPHHEWARLLGMRYGITIGEKDGTQFHIHPDEVFRMIDRLMAAPRQTDA